GPRAAVAAARLWNVVAPGNVEEPDLDGHDVPGGADTALHQRLSAERGPANEVDVARGDARRLRILDERLRVEETEVAGEVEVVGQDLREAGAERAARVGAEVLERHDGDREGLASRTEDLSGDHRRGRPPPRQRRYQRDNCDL